MKLRVLSILTICLSGIGCATSNNRAESTTITRRESSFLGKPAILWIDLEGCSTRLSDAEFRKVFINSLTPSGITHIAIEAVDWSGNGTFTSESKHNALTESLIISARESKLRIAAILPLFVARESDSTESLTHDARWNIDSWIIAPQSPRHLSPAVVGNRRRQLDIIRTLAERPEIETIILAGAGFEQLNADLGPAARRSFEDWSGTSARNWPSEVLGDLPAPLPFGELGRGPLWNTWTTWRADTMKRFLTDCRAEILSASGEQEPPNLAIIVDSPYPMHQRMGVNWAGLQSFARTDHPWLPQGYENTAIGNLADAVALGYWEPTLLRQSDAARDDYAWWASMEGSTMAAQRYITHDTARWGVVEIQSHPGWATPVRLAANLNQGLIILSASKLLENPERISTLRDILR